MKTVKVIGTNALQRMPDMAAHYAVKSGHWVYVPKSVWKQFTRPETQAN